MARRVYLRGGVGVGAFKKIFGGRKSRGTIKEKFSTGSGSIARHILKQLEALKIVEKVPGGKGCVPLVAPAVAAPAPPPPVVLLIAPCCRAGGASHRRASATWTLLRARLAASELARASQLRWAAPGLRARRAAHAPTARCMG